jgi:hypothetical protein
MALHARGDLVAADALAQESRFGVDQAREFGGVARMDCRHGSPERFVLDRRTIEQRDDRIAIRSRGFARASRRSAIRRSFAKRHETRSC